MNDKKVKTKVLIMSTKYQSGHSKAGRYTHFIAKIEDGEKLHTIRGNYEQWKKCAEQINNGEMVLSLRIWTGRPYGSPMFEVKRIEHLHVQRFDAHKDEGGNWCWYVDGIRVSAELLAKNDGLNVEDWKEWMLLGKNKKGIENGALLQLTDFMY